ncbi:hypothetical protein HQ545_04855 [Candidatus Woesearchaeota archaeon]|nr:hypothetical protein [Candidatus Woesearchaeota archaeon]
MEDIASFGCTTTLPDKTSCDSISCCLDNRMQQTEIQVHTADDVCMDDYYDAPDFPWRGGRNL